MNKVVTFDKSCSAFPLKAFGDFHRPTLLIFVNGGVTPTEVNLKAWLEAGVHCVGIGSQLISKNIIQNKEYKQLEELSRSVIAIAQRDMIA